MRYLSYKKSIVSNLMLTTSLRNRPPFNAIHIEAHSNFQYSFLKKSILYLILLDCIAPLNSLSQGPSQTSSELIPKFHLKFSPTQAIDIFGSPSTLFSFERQIGNTSLTLDLGIFFYSTAYISKNRGWRGGLEYRKYLESETTRYISVAYMIKDQQYQYTDSIDFDGLPSYLKDVAYSKMVHAVSIIYGERLYISDSRFFTETYMGIGLRYKNTNVSGLTHAEIENIDMGDSQVTALLNWRGRHFLPNIVFGFKIGFTFSDE